MKGGHQKIMYNMGFYSLIIKFATLFKRQSSHRRGKRNVKSKPRLIILGEENEGLKNAKMRK